MSGDGDVTVDRHLNRKGDVTEYRLKLLEQAVQETSKILASINVTLQQLATLEVHHAETREALERAFTKLASLDGRLAEVELKLPVLILTSSWVRGGVIGILTLVGAAIIKLIILR